MSLDHTLVVFNAVDVPEDVKFQIARLLAPYNFDVYSRPCDADGYTSR
ncbi:hypothetical protein [Microbacterium rhizophilus]